MRYRVYWREYHEQEVDAQNEDDAVMRIDTGSAVLTYTGIHIEMVEEIGESEPDEMEVAKDREVEEGISKKDS